MSTEQRRPPRATAGLNSRYQERVAPPAAVPVTTTNRGQPGKALTKASPLPLPLPPSIAFTSGKSTPAFGASAAGGGASSRNTSFTQNVKNATNPGARATSDISSLQDMQDDMYQQTEMSKYNAAMKAHKKSQPPEKKLPVTTKKAVQAMILVSIMAGISENHFFTSRSA